MAICTSLRLPSLHITLTLLVLNVTLYRLSQAISESLMKLLLERYIEGENSLPISIAQRSSSENIGMLRH